MYSIMPIGNKFSRHHCTLFRMSCLSTHKYSNFHSASPSWVFEIFVLTIIFYTLGCVIFKQTCRNKSIAANVYVYHLISWIRYCISFNTRTPLINACLTSSLISHICNQFIYFFKKEGCGSNKVVLLFKSTKAARLKKLSSN